MLDSAATAFVVGLGALIALNRAAVSIGFVDRPGGRKDHATATPVTGGIAAAIGMLVASIAFADITPALAALGGAGAILLAIGALDDVIDVPWPYRVLAQTMAAWILILGGVRVENLGPLVGFGAVDLGVFSVPFTLIATVGLINALNMCDGVDGLAGGLGLCAIAMLSAAAAYSSNMELLQVLVTAAGALGAFMLLNMRLPWQPRAKAFLGNSGSALLGLFIAWASFRLTQNPLHPVSPVLAPFLIAPPVIDCLVLIFRRLRRGASPFTADRGHMHHLLLDRAFRPSMVVAILCAASLTIGLAAAISLRADVPSAGLLLAFGALTVGYFALTSTPGRVGAALDRLLPDAPAAEKLQRVRI